PEAEGRRLPAEQDPTGEAALAQATVGVDPCDVVSLSEALESPGDPSCYSADAVQRFAALAAELGRLRRLLEQPIVEAVAGIATAIGLDVELLAGPPERAAAAAANLAAFLDHAANFAGIEGEADALGFLDWLAAAREAEDGLDVGAVSAADTVKLLTVHKAKGLEWEMVAVPGLVKGTFPSERGRPLWTSAARVLPYTLRGDAADLPADPAGWVGGEMTSFQDACKAEVAEEERRLAYVAITRARRTLLVSGYQWSPTRTTICELSPFLKEVREHLQAHGSDAEEWPSDAGADPVRPGPAGGTDVAWPPALDQSALDARRKAAGRVLAALGGADVRAGQVLDAGDGATVARWQLEADLLLDDLAAERTAARDVPVPRSLTTSQVVRMRADPSGLAGDLARPMPRRPSPAARRGTRFHAWVEEMFAARPLIGADELIGADTALPEDAELDALRAAFERSPYAGIRPHRVEAPFQLVAGGHLIRGRIDAVYRLDEGRWDVIDYKTGDQPRDPAAAALQLAVYRLAWADLAGVALDAVDAGFLYVRTGEVVRPPALPDRAGVTALLDLAGAG
ncbi:MAG: PD-(D/E)XK nuclease family protein, partial [Actinomycetota bacterium]|nr:PD-(D/E)XK nuclease family protein [Actinomycetota bacterium]